MVQGKIPATLPGTRSTPFVVGQAPMPVAPESLKVRSSRPDLHPAPRKPSCHFRRQVWFFGPNTKIALRYGSGSVMGSPPIHRDPIKMSEFFCAKREKEGTNEFLPWPCSTSEGGTSEGNSRRCYRSPYVPFSCLIHTPKALHRHAPVSALLCACPSFSLLLYSCFSVSLLLFFWQVKHLDQLRQALRRNFEVPS